MLLETLLDENEIVMSDEIQNILKKNGWKYVVF